MEQPKLMILLLLLVYTVTGINGMKCNSLEGLCDLRIDQVTFPGAHNAGSDSSISDACFWRNHNSDFSQQFLGGVRYFDIDTCWHDNKVKNCHCGAFGCRYGTDMSITLNKLDTVVKCTSPEYCNEVLILHFNQNAKGDKEKIGKGLESLLTNLWDPNNGNNELKMSTYYKNNNNNQWPTLRQAIESKQRIFVFMDEEPAGYINPEPDWLLKSNDFITSTYSVATIFAGCNAIVSQARSKCKTSESFVELSAFDTFGGCSDARARDCSKDEAISEAMDECYTERERLGKTVNFLSVDYAVDSVGYETLSVVDRAKTINEKNIKKFNP